MSETGQVGHSLRCFHFTTLSLSLLPPVPPTASNHTKIFQRSKNDSCRQRWDQHIPPQQKNFSTTAVHAGRNWTRVHKVCTRILSILFIMKSWNTESFFFCGRAKFNIKWMKVAKYIFFILICDTGVKAYGLFTSLVETMRFNFYFLQHVLPIILHYTNTHINHLYRGGGYFEFSVQDCKSLFSFCNYLLIIFSKCNIFLNF